MDLADGQGWDHALLTTLFNPRPPAPKCGLTFLLSHRWMQEERGGRASCTTTHSLSILKPGEGGNRVQPEAAHRCHLCLEVRTLVGGAEVSRALTSVVGGFPIGTSPPITSVRSGASDKPAAEKGQ